MPSPPFRRPWEARFGAVAHHMSMGVEYSVDPSRTSGGRYHSVTTSLEYVFVGTDLALASPEDEGDGHQGAAPSCTSLQCCIFPRGPPTEVSQLELSSLVDEQVLGFEVSVQDLSPMTVSQTTQQLEHEDLWGGEAVCN